MEFSYLNCTGWINELTHNTPKDLSDKMKQRNLAGMIFVCMMIVVGIIGNILVIVVFAFKYNKSTYRVYVLCLAFLDMINCCFTMPFVLTYMLFSQNYPNEALCKIGHFVGFYIGLASPFTLLLIAFDRYRNICQPLCHQLSEKKAKVSCLVINVISLVLSWHVPVIYGNTEQYVSHLNMTVVRCYKEDNFLAEKITWWQYIILTIILVLVTILLAVGYFIIMIRVRHKSKYFSALTKTGNSGNSSDDTRAYVTKNIQSKKTTMTFFIITSVYMLSSYIHHALAIILHTTSDLECKMSYTQGAVFWTFFWTIFINNIANPFIYGLSDQRFRQHLKNAFTKSKTRPTAWIT